MIGTTLSHYKIVSELGRGGMGIVYKATDTKLNRTVALKVLPAAALASEDDRARFFREAQSAAQLHHPNIATVFQIDEAVAVDESGNEVNASDGPRPFIAMEFVEGETLQDVVKIGPLKLADAVRIASMVAEALKAAHSKEIVHRDIKSANVILTREGVAKVLDFGLAKTNQSTMLTRMGSTLGTVAYMSPEQARGQEVDGRSDLYSLGTVLYEMISGQLPFAGEYEQAVVYGILNESPEALTAVRTGVPMGLEWIVNKLMSKEPRHRYQTAADLVADLETVDLSGSGQSRRSMAAISTAQMPVAVSPVSSFPKWYWAVIGLAILTGAVGSWIAKPEPILDRDTAVRRYTLMIPGLAEAYAPAVSPDGKTLVISGEDSTGNSSTYLIDLATSQMSKVSGIEDSFYNLFSPDGSRLLVRLAGGVSSIPVTGGTAHSIGTDVRDANWMPDNSIIYRKENELWLLPASGEEERQLTMLDSTETSHAFPQPLPDGRHVIFHFTQRGETRIRLSLLDIETGVRTDLGPGSHPKYLNSGHLLYGDGSSPGRGPLMLRPFDSQTFEFQGPEFTWHYDAPWWLFGVDRHGTWYDLLDSISPGATDRDTLYEVEPDGLDPTPVFDGDVENPRLSPDGGRVALTVENGNDDYLMILNLSTGVEERITFSEDVDHFAWSADGESIMLSRNGKIEIWSSGGLGLERALPIEAASFLDWSADGRYVVYVNDHSDVGPLRLFDMETERDTLFESNQSSRPRFSPDGRFITYDSSDDEGVRSYVRATSGAGFARLSLDEPQSRRPVWSKDGSSIYVDAILNHVVQIPVDISDSFVQTGRGRTILSTRGSYEFDVRQDGTLFILGHGLFDGSNSGQSRAQSVKLNVIVNWFEQIKQLAPPTK